MYAIRSYYAGGETLTRLDNGIIYGSLREAMVQHPALVKQYLKLGLWPKIDFLIGPESAELIGRQ